MMDFIYMLIGLSITFTVLFCAVGYMVFDRLMDHKRDQACCKHCCDCRGEN